MNWSSVRALAWPLFLLAAKVTIVASCLGVWFAQFQADGARVVELSAVLRDMPEGGRHAWKMESVFLWQGRFSFVLVGLSVALAAFSAVLLLWICRLRLRGASRDDR